MSTVLAAANPAIGASKPIRVMVVDDAIVVRSLLTRWIEAEPDMAVAGTLRTGREAVDGLERCNPDVVILDVDMPVLDGISALPLLLAQETRSRRDHGLDADAPWRRGEPEGAVARRRRLRAEAAIGARRRGIGGVPSRADREDPPSRPPRPHRGAAMVARHRCRANGAGGAAASRGHPAARRRCRPEPACRSRAPCRACC